MFDVNKYIRERRARLKAEGWCVDCQNFQAAAQHVLCDNCLEAHRVRDKKSRLLKKIGKIRTVAELENLVAQ